MGDMKNIKNTPLSSWSEWFDRAAQVFDDPRMKIAYYQNGQTGEPYSEEAVHLTHQDVFNKLAPRPSDTILDVGCGVGYFTQFFSGKVKKIVGVDVSFHMIETAYTLNPKGFFIVAKADEIPFREMIFDGIFSYGVTQYLPDESAIQRMLDGMRRLLKDGGKILVGDILAPMHHSAAETKSYQKSTAKGRPWWPQELDHNLTKLYIAEEFFLGYCRKDHLDCQFFKQNIPGRPIPTPRYDVVITVKS